MRLICPIAGSNAREVRARYTANLPEELTSANPPGGKSEMRFPVLFVDVATLLTHPRLQLPAKFIALKPDLLEWNPFEARNLREHGGVFAQAEVQFGGIDKARIG